MYKYINLTSLITITATLLVPALVTPASAASYQSHASIHNVAKQFMLNHVKSTYGQKPEIKSGKLDSRLKLRQCTQPLLASLPERSRGIGKVSVAVKCSDHKPWSLHVPVTASLFKYVLVAKEPLPRGKLLEKSDLKRAKYDLARLQSGYINNYENSVGMKLKRSLITGAALTPSILEKPRLISRGQRVTILAQSAGMEIRTSGKALAHGAAGERIGVINTKSRLKIEGIVTASGEVKVDI